MTKQTYIELTQGGIRPVFHGTEEEFRADISKRCNEAKDNAIEQLTKLKEELKDIEVIKEIKDMDFLELERFKLDYFDKIFAIKNIEFKLLNHVDQTVEDGYYFKMDSIGKEFKFED